MTSFVLIATSVIQRVKKKLKERLIFLSINVRKRASAAIS